MKGSHCFLLEGTYLHKPSVGTQCRKTGTEQEQKFHH